MCSRNVQLCIWHCLHVFYVMLVKIGNYAQKMLITALIKTFYQSKLVENIPVVLRSWLLVDCWQNALSYAAVNSHTKTMSLTAANQFIFSPINPIVLILCLCLKPAIMLKIMPAYSTQA